MFKKIIFTATFLVFAHMISYACSCTQGPAVDEYYEKTDLIVIVRIVKIEKPISNSKRGGGYAVVEKVYKGRVRAGEQIFISNGLTNCTIWIDDKYVGRRLLLYEPMPSRGVKDSFYYSVCGRDNNVENAGSDLLYLDNIDRVRGKSRMSGVIKYIESSPTEKYKYVTKSLSNVRVLISESTKSYEVVTNQEGIWEIYGLPEGKYYIEPQIKEPWKVDSDVTSASWPRSKVAYSRPVQQDTGVEKKIELNRAVVETFLPVGKHVEISHTYSPRNSISGLITDSNGKPLTGYWIEAVSADGKTYQGSFRLSESNGPGRFNFEGLTPGKYYIVINDEGKISANIPFESIYYPGVLSKQDATVIEIGNGQDLDNINFQVPRFHETTTISGIMLYANNKPIRYGGVKFVSDKDDDKFDRTSYGRSGDDGRFSFKVLKGSIGRLIPTLYIEDANYTKCTGIKNFKRRGDGYSLFVGEPLPLTADKDVSGLVIKLTFDSCEKGK